MSFNDACNSGNPIIKPTKKDKRLNIILTLLLIIIMFIAGILIYS